MTRSGWIIAAVVALLACTGGGVAAYGHFNQWSIPLGSGFHLAFAGSCGHAIRGPFGGSSVRGVVDGYAISGMFVVGHVTPPPPAYDNDMFQSTSPGFFVLDT
jgi:hypothetical protein